MRVPSATTMPALAVGTVGQAASVETVSAWMATFTSNIRFVAVAVRASTRVKVTPVAPDCETTICPPLVCVVPVVLPSTCVQGAVVKRSGITSPSRPPDAHVVATPGRIAWEVDSTSDASPVMHPVTERIAVIAESTCREFFISCLVGCRSEVGVRSQSLGTVFFRLSEVVCAEEKHFAEVISDESYMV